MPFPVAVETRIIGPFATPTGAGDTLEAQNTTGLPNGACAQVISNHCNYYLDATSVETADGERIIAPATGPGRWFQQILMTAALLWVNPQAAANGTGSAGSPFQTPAEALAAVPSGASATIMLAPADYSATPALSIADRDICLQCAGQSANGLLSPPARAILPEVTLATSASQLQFTAENCDLSAGVTVETAVEANLIGSTAVWTDAGQLSVVFARDKPGVSNGSPINTVSGSFGQLSMFGMTGGDITADGIVATQVGAAAGSTWVADTIILFDQAFGAGVTITASSFLAIDQWTLYQIFEASVDIGANPPLTVQEASSFDYIWGAGAAWDNGYVQPNIKFGTTQATAVFEWQSAPRACWARSISIRINAAVANDVVLTLQSGVNVAGLANTALAVTLTAGQTYATFSLPSPVPLAAGSILAVLLSKAGGVVNNNGLECHVLLL